jgi:RNA polymerase sigma factor (sigma-70 family)
MSTSTAFEQYPDVEIIRRILRGETALFEILIRRCNSVLYKAGRSYGFTHEDTQDLMQDTFIDAYRNLAGFEGRSVFRTWITRIMLNNCFRRRQRAAYRHAGSATINEGARPLFANPDSTDPSKTVVMKELGLVVENALQELSLDYRLVFSLREINGFSVEETANVLDISQANVKTRLTRAKAMLRTEIERSYRKEEIFEFNLVYCDAMVHRVMERLQQA